MGTGPAQPFRLEGGGEIDRSRPLRFRFDGRMLHGYAGDTLASALLANGVRLVGRSFKYHRPRGVLTIGSEEPNALVELRTGARREPNSRATMVELFDGLEAQSQNRWPSLAFDAMAVNDLLAPFIPAGFYYKTFMGAPGWRFWETHIRRAAGLGRGSLDPDPDRYDKMSAHCDVLVIGGGPAGLAAALSAGRTGARVMLLDEGSDLGGRLRESRERIADAPALDWVRGVAAELDALPGVTVLRRTTGFGRYDGNTIGAVERVGDHLAEPGAFAPRQRLWRIRAGTMLTAAGATERPLVFAGNDRPGVMLASAARGYLHRFAVRAGKRAVVFCNNDDGYRTALELAEGGIAVAAVVDCRPDAQGGWREAALRAGIDCMGGHAVIATRGRKALRAVEIMALTPDRASLCGRARTVRADLLALAGGWSPNLHLHTHAGGKPVYDPALAAFLPGPARQEERCIGAARGRFALADCLADGFAAGAAAASERGFDAAPTAPPRVTEEPAASPIQPLWQVPARRGGGKRFVDFQDDVTAEDIALAHREGYVSVEHLKRYTTLGMGTDQGRTSNINGQAIMAEARGLSLDGVGTTTFRPPYTPVTWGALAGREIGRHFAPTRRSAMHDWHAANGAVFVEAGQWLRPQYYLRPDETDSREATDRAITREVVGVRNGVGMVDVSTLGKIDIQGRDAAELLNRVYVNGWSTLPVGRARYGLMLREDGLVLDDGTTSRLGDRHYFMTTTTSNAGEVMSHLELYLQVYWPELDVKVVSVTEQWAAIAIAGPRSRAVLQDALAGVDLSNQGLPFMGVRDCTLAGIPARLFRISFSGELAYEINVPADHGHDAWVALMQAGAPHGIIPYGTEAMGIMRIEKGHVAGPELDGRTTPEDLGLGRMVSRRKAFIGQELLAREGLRDPGRRRLVGLVPVDGQTRVRAGAVLIADPAARPPVAKLGHVTSSAYLSPNLGHPIALALLTGGADRQGETVWAAFPLRGETVECRVVDPVFLDPEGERLHG